MSANSPVAGLTYPSLSDTPNVPANLQTLTGQLDSLVVPVFTASGVRDTAIPSPAQGQMANVAGQLMKYDGTVWLPVRPVRKVTVTKAAAFTLSAATYTNLIWDASVYSADSGIWSGTSASMTVTQTGQWKLSAWWLPPSDGECYIAYSINGNSVASEGGLAHSSTSGNVMVSGFVERNFTSGTTVQVAVYLATAMASTSFPAYKLGASLEMIG